MQEWETAKIYTKATTQICSIGMGYQISWNLADLFREMMIKKTQKDKKGDKKMAKKKKIAIIFPLKQKNKKSKII